MSAHSENWLNAFHDPIATLYTFGSCMALSDLSGDGDTKLIVADLGTGQYNMKLKVYKGTTVIAEETIVDVPTAMVTLFTDLIHPRVPSIAVASGPHIYVYKNLKPYYKFALPSLEIVSLEKEIWQAAADNKLDPDMLREALQNLMSQVPASSLTSRTHKFLTIDEVEERDTFMKTYRTEPLKRQSVITCMCTLKKSSQEADAIDSLVFGTEDNSISIIEAEAFTVVSAAMLPAVPVFIFASGLLDVEYRLLICCRNGEIYTLKRGSKGTTKATIELNCPAVGMARVAKTIVVGCMDDTLRCYNLKGKKLWSLPMPGSIMTIEPFDYQSKNYSGVIVALANAEVHIYRDLYLVDRFALDQVATGLKFGSFGREEGAMVLALQNGGLLIKLLKRSAKFEEKSQTPGPPAAQGQKLNLPKKTKVFVDQTIREREQAIQMHQTFQRDMFMLRLHTARTYAKTLKNASNPISVNTEHMLRLNANVNGFGPTFMLNIFLQVIGGQPIQGLVIFFQYDSHLYEFEKNQINASFLAPAIDYPFQTKVKCLSDKGMTDDVKVLVVKPDQKNPLVTALITMPVSEMPLVD